MTWCSASSRAIFEPVVRTVAAQYESQRQGGDIVIEARGSEDGVSQRWNLTGAGVALSCFTLVVHKDIDLGPDGSDITNADVAPHRWVLFTVCSPVKGRYPRACCP
ncbi:hypothetical protein ADL34_10000 [Streptomyces sp. NRRL WC-3605]|nr:MULTISPECIES: hypothetical protein [unclassified Streptomyces]KUL70667.1 hypothetical protein ADL33_27840 [Streptomyces sp. NRRL WC-3604]KUL77271.1 hypothetical protein ADL34_10000 [Streptomyces sp. NRRL WC-3605]